MWLAFDISQEEGHLIIPELLRWARMGSGRMKIIPRMNQNFELILNVVVKLFFSCSYWSSEQYKNKKIKSFDIIFPRQICI